MSIISADFAFDKSQLVFNFISSERVDFRELAKKLASIYHTRIELRQVGARDKAKEISGIGVCGQKLCCSKFLNEIDAITMNMAKDQNLALNPSKINGLCGRLLCCLQYEDEEYVRCGKGMPSVGETIKTDNGDGTVISVDILNRKCKVLVGSNKEEISFDDK
jgi:cell fate regulator YaaT (PSP1 superfamily)